MSVWECVSESESERGSTSHHLLSTIPAVAGRPAAPHPWTPTTTSLAPSPKTLIFFGHLWTDSDLTTRTPHKNVNRCSRLVIELFWKTNISLQQDHQSREKWTAKMWFSFEGKLQTKHDMKELNYFALWPICGRLTFSLVIFFGGSFKHYMVVDLVNFTQTWTEPESEKCSLLGCWKCAQRITAGVERRWNERDERAVSTPLVSYL